MESDGELFSSIRSPRLSEVVEDRIKEAIFSGQMHVGEKLPPDRELAKLWGVSRPVVREALRALESSGLVTIKTGANGGAFITPVSKRPILESFDVMIRAGQISHEEILQARLVMEPSVAAEAARMATAEDVADLEETIRVLEEGFRTGDVYLEHNPNPNLHRVIAKATRNQLLIIVMDMLMNKATQRLSTIRLDDRAKATIADDHRAIVEAIRAHDEDRSREAMTTHVHNVYRIHKALEDGQPT